MDTMRKIAGIPVLLLIVMLSWSAAWAVEISDLNLAVVWNQNTGMDKANTPYPLWSSLATDQEDDQGWRDAPEVGKAQLKLWLAAVSGGAVDVDETNSLDTVGIPEELTYGDGFSFNGTNDILENIAIYNNTHFYNGDFDLAKLNADFDGENPDAIIYINGGAAWSESGDDNGFYDLLLKAAEAGIGILTIGDASVSDARSIDPAKTTFPIMGVQNWYWFKSFNGTTVREFNFLAETDGSDWESPDEIHFRMDEVGGEDLYRIGLGEWTVAPPDAADIIYEATVGESPNYDITVNKNDITYTEGGQQVEVRHANGEWSVYAKAVDVIERDTYAPEMNAGVFINHDIILAYEPNTEEIYIVNALTWNNQWPDTADWGSELWADGDVLKTYGEALPGLENSADLDNYGEVVEFTDSNGTDREAFRFTRDYSVKNPNTDREMLVIEEGRQIADFISDGSGDGDDLLWYNLADPSEPCNYFGSYSSGEYKDLKLQLYPEGDRAQIFDNVFPRLTGIDELEFRHWVHNSDTTGRLRAAADIWAFNEKLDLLSFEELFDPDAQFDPDAYYVNYLGDQAAGEEGIPNFVQPPQEQDEFGSSFNEKLVDSLGYDEDGKLYHAISVVQTGRRRLGMLGFQPTYLADVDLTKLLLEDITKWIAVDDWRFPDPHINLVYDGTTEPADGRLAYIDADSIELEVDFTVKGSDLRSSSYNAVLDITYNGNEYQLRKDSIDREAKLKVDTISFNLGEAFTVDPEDNGARDIEIKAAIEPISMRFLPGESEGSLKLRKLESPSFDADDDKFEREIEVRISEEGDVDDNAVSDDVFIQVTDPTNENGGSVFGYMLTEAGTVRAYAYSDRYLDSDLNESEPFTQEATMPPPQADSSSGSVLFADDTLNLSVDLSNLDSEPDYEIEYSVNYDGREVISTRGERNESVEILLADFIDRENRAATDFTVTAKTIGIDDIWNDSREVDFNYTVRKLGTNPDQPQNIDFWNNPSLTVAASYNGTEYDGDVHGEPAYIQLGEDANTVDRTEESRAQFDFTETNSFSFVFWAEHTRYIHSDIVENNDFVVDQKKLPNTVAAPTDDQANNRDEYHFYDPYDIRISLDRDDTNYDDVDSGDFVMDISGDITRELYQKSSNDLDITMDIIDNLIDMGRGTRTLDFRGRANPAEGVDYWVAGDEQTYSYDFRTIDLAIEVVDGNEDSDSLGIEFTAADPVNTNALDDARIFYTYENHDMDPEVLDTTDASTYSGSADHGQEVTIPNGVVLTGVGFRNGYVPNSPDDGTDIFIQEAVLLVNPEDQTAFGDSLEVSLRSNLSPIYYEVYGEEGMIDGMSGTVILDKGDPAPGDSVDVPFRAWVEGDDVTEGVEESRMYYRRMLPDVVVDPPSGQYPGEIEVTMSNSVDAAERNIFYSYDASPTQDDNLYGGPFTVTPDIDVFSRAYVNPDVVESNGAGGWLSSNTDEKNYRRVTTGVEEGSAYFDQSSVREDLVADGIIDLAVVELTDRWEDLELPESAECVFPGTSQSITVTEDIQWEDADDLDNTRILIPLDFEDVNTGFAADEYITLTGTQYIDEPVMVGDSVAPVIESASYLSGEFSLDGEMTSDTLIVGFSEEIRDISGDVVEESLFLLGKYEDAYEGLFTDYDRRDNATYEFIVNRLGDEGKYPAKNDSIWIDILAGVDIEDSHGNAQTEELNRRVEMNVERRQINVRLDAFWINDMDAFRSVNSYDQLGEAVGSDDDISEIAVGGAIIIDPLITFTESEALSDDFDANVTILDEVGNQVISVEGKNDDNEHIKVVPRLMTMRTPPGERHVLVIPWNGKNSNGRQVHSRSYKVIANTIWPGIDGSIQVNGIIPVYQKYNNE